MGAPRRRGKRARRVLTLLAVLVVVAAVAGAWTFHEHYPRDEAGYLAYLRQYPGAVQDSESAGPDAALASARAFTTPPQAMIVAGDRACAWLSHQSYAGTRTGPTYRVGALAENYAGSAESHALGWTGYPDAGAVQAAAWSYLCPGTMELHKPHWLFGSPPD